MGRKVLYQITDLDGNILVEAATTPEVADFVGKSQAAIRAAVAGGGYTAKKYMVEPIDHVLSPTLDIRLLLDWDITRKEILKIGKNS